MRDALVIDGHNGNECGEGVLVRQLLARRGMCDVTYLTGSDGPLAIRRALTKPWTLVWFAGHCTIYRSCQRGSLEWKDGRALRQLFTSEQVKTTQAKLMVLSSCHTYGGPFAGAYASEMVVAHKDTVYFEDSLVFAARFVTELARSSWRWWPDKDAVRYAFIEATAAVLPAGDRGWRLEGADP